MADNTWIDPKDDVPMLVDVLFILKARPVFALVGWRRNDGKWKVNTVTQTPTGVTTVESVVVATDDDVLYWAHFNLLLPDNTSVM